MHHRFEFVRCLFISWFFNPTPLRPLKPKRQIHSLSLSFSAARTHRYFGCWEHKAQPIVTIFAPSLCADGATRRLSALVSFSHNCCRPVDYCFIHHLLSPVSLYCYRCNSLLESVSRLYASEHEQWSFSLPEDLLRANCCFSLWGEKLVASDSIVEDIKEPCGASRLQNTTSPVLYHVRACILSCANYRLCQLKKHRCQSACNLSWTIPLGLELWGCDSIIFSSEGLGWMA